ncbi:hypothetical protein AB0I60_14390 [Actinosynnema sp. NPDC050436]|uniref:hypothetical protein n=1 Tax=Actinosynnema sp. NPDC050436 TaxID=3155659 RepID=UPI0033F816C5
MIESVIDPGLVPALHEAVRRGAPPERTGIRVTARGWAVGEWTGESAYPVALTGADLPDASDGLDVGAAARLCAPAEPGRSHYGIPDEQGDVLPCPEAGTVFVTGGQPWTRAWWFERAGARRVVREAPRGDGVESVWLTPGGAYVAERARPDEVWTELSPDEAVRRVYEAGAEHDEDDSTDLVRAARHARDAVAALTGGLTDLPGAVATGETARALSDLVRTTVVADLRAARARAAYRIYEFTDRDASRAANFLRVGRAAAKTLIEEGRPRPGPRTP